MSINRKVKGLLYTCMNPEYFNDSYVLMAG